MKAITKFLAGGVAIAAFAIAAPAAAQIFPGMGYPGYGGMGGYGYSPYGGYGVNSQMIVSQCANAVQARLSGDRPDFDEFRLLPIDSPRNLAKRAPTSAPNLLKNGAHVRLQRRIRALPRPRQGRGTLGLPDRSPVEPLHSIIFSIGTTRIADAPAAFSFCKVSQKTDSWQTA